jgi:threonine synthase
MDTTESFRGLACTDCGATFDPDHLDRCPDCGAPLAPEYDYDAVPNDPNGLDRSDDGSGVWRYADLLPIPAESAVTISEGGTPLVDAPRLADELETGTVLIKDESRNPTGTVLDRGLSLAVTGVRAFGGDDSEPLAQAAPGNAAQSAAAYAGRADLRSYAFVPSRAPFSNKAMINVHGGEMRVVGGRYPDALSAVSEQLATDWTSLQEFTNPYRHEGAKTVAYEVLADLGWAAPDAVVTPVGTGEVLVGLAEGFRSAVEVGWVSETPRLFAVQPEGCAPLVEAFESGADTTEPVAHPDTIVGELEIPDPAGGDLALSALASFDGGAVAVEDESILRSAVTTAGSEGVEMGAAGGASAAGAWELSGEFDADATVVLVNTESGGKTADVLRSHLMGQGV